MGRDRERGQREKEGGCSLRSLLSDRSLSFFLPSKS